MADRTSAGIFGVLFTELAKNPDERAKVLALKMWKESQHCDFTDDQMGCDRALVKLGLARKGIDPAYPDDGPTMLYGPAKKKSARNG